jgi:anti-sigma28 factor (negative regulator of flagellin synthesis)
MDLNSASKLQHTLPLIVTPPVAPAPPRKTMPAAAAQPVVPQPGVDQVTLSAQAIQAQNLASRISSAPAARTDNADKLASVQQQIQASTYQVPAAKVAEKLLLGN